MTADTMVIVERVFPQSRELLFDAWTDPEQMSQWRGSPGWHVEKETVVSQLRTGGRHHHVKVVDDDPTNRVTTDAIFTEFFRPDVFVALQRISGDPGMDPTLTMELRVEFTEYRRHGTLVRVIQGPYEAAEAGKHSTGWELEMQRLADFLESRGGSGGQR